MKQDNEEKIVQLLETLVNLNCAQAVAGKGLAEAIKLLKDANVDNKVIATTLNIAESTVRSSMSKGRKKAK